jgi:hypothetical protein
MNKILINALVACSCLLLSFIAGQKSVSTVTGPIPPIIKHYAYSLDLNEWSRRIEVWDMAAKVAGRCNASVGMVDLVRDSVPVWNDQLRLFLYHQVIADSTAKKINSPQKASIDSTKNKK